MKLPSFNGNQKKKSNKKKPQIEIEEIEDPEVPFYSDATENDQTDGPLIQDVEKQIKSKKALTKVQTKKIKKTSNILKKNSKISCNNVSRTKKFSFAFGGSGAGSIKQPKKKQKIEEAASTAQFSTDGEQDDKPCMYKKTETKKKNRTSKREKAETEEEKINLQENQHNHFTNDDQFQWVEFNDECKEFVPQALPHFNLTPGIKKPELLISSDPWAFFSSIMRKEFFEQTAYNTNEYAAKFKQQKPKCSYLIGWEGTDWKEMSAFFGLNFLFGLLCRSQLEEHWTTHPLTFSPFTQTVMTYRRFQILRQFICFYDVWAVNPHKDPLFKINYFVETILKNSEDIYQPEKYLAIDESMIKYKGDNKMRIYVINKPIQCNLILCFYNQPDGFRAFVLCESSSGFVLRWFLDRSQELLADEETKHTSFTYQICKYLLKGYENKGYQVFMDRFYTSPELFLALRKLNIGACGTVQWKRLSGMTKGQKIKIFSLSNGEKAFFYSKSFLFHQFLFYLFERFFDPDLLVQQQVSITNVKLS